MRAEKPKTEEDYQDWLLQEHGVMLPEPSGTHYELISTRIKQEFERGSFWSALSRDLRGYSDEYLIANGYDLLTNGPILPALQVKSFKSFILKTFRRNILENRSWPKPPDGGWCLPDNWFAKINDIVRTVISVKYLDGVEFLLNKMKGICGNLNIKNGESLQATQEGYYAAHLYIHDRCAILDLRGQPLSTQVQIEIQITTQLQEVIRKLLHKYYEEQRCKPKEARSKDWQWDYKCGEFAANYLGHILHYVEGMIMDVRKRQKETLK